MHGIYEIIMAPHANVGKTTAIGDGEAKTAQLTVKFTSHDDLRTLSAGDSV